MGCVGPLLGVLIRNMRGCSEQLLHFFNEIGYLYAGLKLYKQISLYLISILQVSKMTNRNLK